MVQVQEVFEVFPGNDLVLSSLQFDRCGIPFVARTSKNNGVTARVALISDVTPSPAHSLSVACGGSVLSVFYQDAPYYSGFHIRCLVPKIDLNSVEMLAYATCLAANKYKFNYGRQANRTIKYLDVPDPRTIRHLATNFNLNEDLSTDALDPRPISLYERQWEYFRFDRLFEIKKGVRLTKSNMRPGATPFIASIDSNNGYSESIDKDPLHLGNTITVNYNGSVAEAFYQPIAFWASDDVNVLYPKFQMNQCIGLFICTLIKKEKYRFNYGRKWKLSRMLEAQLKLPVNVNGSPDWEFIERYVQSLPGSVNLSD